MKTKKVIFLIFCLFVLSSNFKIYQPYEVINYLNKDYYPKKDLDFIKKSISKILYDFYAFYELAKSPPQPEYDQNFYNKVDFKKELDEIKTENTSFYNFYRDLLKPISNTKDGHFFTAFLNLNETLSQFAVVFPFKLDLHIYEEKPRIFCESNIKDNYNSSFINFENINETINKNKDIPIKSINGIDPSDFISNFGKNYFDLRSPHANFPIKFKMLQKPFTLSSFPLGIEELTNLTIIYDNNETFTTDAVIDSKIDIYGNDTDDIILNNVKRDIKKFYFHEIENLRENFKELNDILIDEKDKNDSILEWDYNYTDIFKCRVDDTNKINVYFIKEFYGDNIVLYIDAIVNCSLLFDQNDYPVILINNLNPGGYAVISQLLLELLSPLFSVNCYFAIRKTEAISAVGENDDNTYGYSVDTCEAKSLKKLLKETKIEYWDGISDTLSQPFIFFGKDFREMLNDLKMTLENKRKPTDIIVFTDGFSYSATSVLLKYLQYNGGGITVGYLGNPNKRNIPFDSSLSPSAIIENLTLFEVSDEYRKLYKNYTFLSQMAFFQSFYHPSNFTIPLEYVITPVDEVEEFYEYYSDDNYDKFINISKKIFNKYKNECNPKNKKLVLVNSECDKNFTNNYTHGGYECGDDGKWTSNCIASYCDIGYIFDHVKNECIIDACSKITEEQKEEKEEDQGIDLILIIIIIGSILLVIILLIVIICVCIKKKKKDDDYLKENDLKININEEEQ